MVQNERSSALPRRNESTTGSVILPSVTLEFFGSVNWAIALLPSRVCVPGIHVLLDAPGKDVDGRDKPGQDGESVHFLKPFTPSSVAT